MIEPSLDLYGEAAERVDAVLVDLLAQSRARYALVVDRQGFVLLHQRAPWAPKPPSLDSLATLVASNHSANVAIAKLFGEDGFRETVQQGDGVGTYVEALGERALLLTVFDETAPLGKVKLFTKRAVARIREVLADVREAPPELTFGSAFSADAGALLDDLFDDGTRA
jgi:predicted regulator of Ras-like GTPase activity (Roadblock/LC7/MglB family)